MILKLSILFSDQLNVILKNNSTATIIVKMVWDKFTKNKKLQIINRD